jgi:hypothetical protein
MTDQYYFDEIDIWEDWGLFPPRDKGFYKSLLKAPARKYLLTKNWTDQNGTQRAFSKVDYDNRELELPFILFATSREDLLIQYNSLKAYLYTHSSITLSCIDLDRQFILSYKGMPNFNKLTPFYDDGNIAVELTLNVVDENPTVFKDKDGVVMPMPFPADIPDASIDFNDYDFEIIDDGSLIMSGEGLLIEGNAMNGNDLLNTYGLIPQKGFDNALLKLGEAKNDVPLKFETRELQLPFIMQAASSVEFYYRYYQLVAFFLQSRYFNLDIGQLGKRFKLCYSDMASIDKLFLVSSNDNVLASLTITCLDDYPTEEEELSVFDGQFSTNEFGDLIYSQSDEFDEGLTFDLVDDDLIVRT